MKKKDFLPHNVEAEKLLLSCLIENNSLFLEISKKITSDMFFEIKNSTIFDTISYLIEQGITANLETLGQEFISDKDKIIYLSELENKAPATIYNCNFYIEKIIEAYQKRKILQLNEKLDNLINTPKYDFSKIQKSLEKEISNILDEKTTLDRRIKSLLENKPEEKNIENEFLYNLTTPTLHFNNLFKNLIIYENELISITGESGIGKTTIALKMIKELMLYGKTKYRFLILSKELNTYVTTCKLAGISPYSKTAINSMEEELYRDDLAKYKFIRNNDKISIISRKDLENNNIKDDIEVLKESIRHFKTSKKQREELFSFENFDKAIKDRKEEEHLIILIDYFNIMETGEKFISEYEKEAHLIEELKNIRDTNQDVTIFVINTVNKTSMNTNKHQGSIKGNTEIIYGLNLALTMNKISGKDIKEALADNNNSKETFRKILESYDLENHRQDIEEFTFIKISSLKQRFIDNTEILLKTRNFNKFFHISHKKF